MTDQIPALSRQAARLLAHLRACCHTRQLAAPDRILARIVGVPERDVVDLADELLQHGHLVIAATSAPRGRWLLLPRGELGLPAARDGEDLQAARAYERTLLGRALGIFRRRRHLRHAIAAAESRRRVESTGQGRLF